MDRIERKKVPANFNRTAEVEKEIEKSVHIHVDKLKMIHECRKIRDENPSDEQEHDNDEND